MVALVLMLGLIQWYFILIYQNLWKSLSYNKRKFQMIMSFEDEYNGFQSFNFENTLTLRSWTFSCGKIFLFYNYNQWIKLQI
jgi:hypothetical protein